MTDYDSDMERPASARYIWTDGEGQGRSVYARFRAAFELGGEPVRALLGLFADTSYQLFVNGRYVEAGPIRFDPRHPKFDAVDIRSCLRPGRNVIAVQANYVGHKTFMTMLSRAGFIAWGDVETDTGERVFLETNGDSLWRVSAVPAYRYAPKSSLFLRAAELYDQRLDADCGWTDSDFDDKKWSRPCELSSEETYGRLTPRNLPYMSGRPLKPSAVLAVLPLSQAEEWHSFEVALPHVAEIHMPNSTSPFLAFKSWIYAPEDCIVTAGAYYQTTWINGVKIESSLESATSGMRLNQRWNLKQGWNAYFGCVDAYQDIFQHYIALPAGRGLIVSADRDPSTGVLFRRSPVVSQEVYDTALKSKVLPYDITDELGEVGGWIETTAADKGESPCRESSWDRYGEPFEQLRADELAGRVFRLSDYPEGFALLLDMGLTGLAWPNVELAGVGDAAVDLTYSEHLMADGLHLRHTHWYGLGDRAIGCGTRDTLRWRISQPRGFRYLKLTMRGAKEDVRLGKLELISAAYPAELKGRFNSSDPLLNEIWKLGARTQSANMEDGYDDCVTRERGQYIRDTVIQYHNNLALFGDQRLMYRSLELIGQSPDATGKFRAVYPNDGDYTIADFALNALEGFWAYYERTGDAGLAAKYWAEISTNLAWFHELADEQEGLLLDAEWDVKRGVKAHYGGFHGDLQIVEGYMANTGLHCVFSCTYLIAMRCAAKLARVIGKDADADWLERRIETLAESIRRVFWDEKRGRYADNDAKSTWSMHASLFAVRAEAATEAQIIGIRNSIAAEFRSLFANGIGPEDGVFVSPSFSFYIFDGLYRVGLPGIAEQMMREGWGWMLRQGLPQAPEYFSLDSSLCHAWSACPSYFLTRYVLGVDIKAVPNADEVTIRVQTASVTAAEGAVPHPKGLVEVKWHLDDKGNRIFDYIRAPEGVTVVVADESNRA